jgi:type II secretory pathway pseudopilin PulG
LQTRGFTLVEAAVAIGVASILAGMMAPMAVRVLDLERADRTREQLRQAWEALFGARDRSLPNMRSDFGFRITDGMNGYDLGLLVTPDLGPGGLGPDQPAPRVQPYGPAPGGGRRLSGWRGPYWHGPVQNRLPVDPWGHPIVLAVGPDGSVQVRSQGPGGPDGEIRYPQEGISPAALGATVYLNFSSRSVRRLRATFEYEQLARGQGPFQVETVCQSSRAVHDLAPGRAEPEPWPIPVGQCTVYIEQLPGPDGPGEDKAGPPQAPVGPPRATPAQEAPAFERRRVVQEYALTLLPGETRSVDVSLP